MPDRNFSFFLPVNMLSAQLIRPLYGQYTKKGLGTINKEKRREIKRFARIEILVRQYARLTAWGVHHNFSRTYYNVLCNVYSQRSSRSIRQ